MKNLILIILLLFLIGNTDAQYFGGPNKPGYKVFEYKVYTSPNFEIYHYFNNDSLIVALAQSAEKWYQRHLMIFGDSFKKRNPLIIYADHADFQQTNAIFGNIGVGTGGVTEALKNRIIMPVFESAAQTDHIIGHELVHAFQYNLMLHDDSAQLRNLRNIPLWMIEGKAEYLSIGSIDAHTAMWMRDAILNNDFPSLDDMTRSYKYFPYRYGQAFWAFVTAIYGDSIVRPLFDITTKLGYEKALDSLVHLDEKAFSNVWKAHMKEFYLPLMADTLKNAPGKKIISQKNSGAVNIAPALSPDGKHLIYLSEKDLFTFDLYIADAQTGKKVRRISSTIRDNQIDDFNYLESGGSWSPNGRYFAFVTFSKGRNRLLIVDVKKRKNVKETDIPGLSAFSNPAWSPDGSHIVVSGLVEGVSDLYAFYPETNKVENLTNDVFCNLMADWSPDGKTIAFITDQPLSQTEPYNSANGYRLATLDVVSRKIEVLPVFNGAANMHPRFAPDSRRLYFLSDADGFRNLYVYSLDSGTVYRLTKINTGISGVTKFTPALTVSRTTGHLAYVHFWKGEYNLYYATDTSFVPDKINPDYIDFTAAQLPPAKRAATDIVNPNLLALSPAEIVPADSLKPVPYKPKFQLDYIGGSNVGVGVSSYYGTGVAGSVDMLFSDIVGNYQMFSSLAINGEIYDFAGAAAFINNKQKIDWGVGISHIPYRYGYYSRGMDSIGDNAYNRISLNYHRIFEDAINLFAIRPLSQTRRIEVFGSFAYYSNRVDRYNYYYDNNGYSVGQTIDRNLPSEKGFGIISGGVAYTLDNAFMGIASPLRGQRFRIEGGYYTGSINFFNFLFDVRKYIYIKPFSIAMRLYHQGRYGTNTTNYVMRSLYIGWPWLVRGFFNYDPGIENQGNLSQLYGSRIGVANLELRIPFTGPERLCIIPFKYLFTELSFFADAGIAWNSYNKLTLNRDANKYAKVNYINMAVSNKNNTYVIDPAQYRYPMASYGISLRFNLFGYMILEPYYAIPFYNTTSDVAGISLNFLPGW